MKLYYYYYESTVLSPFNDASYKEYDGFLIESPLGILEFYCDDEFNIFNSIEEFKRHIKTFYPKNFDIVNLK